MRVKFLPNFLLFPLPSEFFRLGISFLVKSGFSFLEKVRLFWALVLVGLLQGMVWLGKGVGGTKDPVEQGMVWLGNGVGGPVFIGGSGFKVGGIKFDCSSF